MWAGSLYAHSISMSIRILVCSKPISGSPRRSSSRWNRGCGEESIVDKETCGRVQSVHLNNRGFRRVAEHRAALRNESIAPGFQLLHCGVIEFFPDTKVHRALNYRNVLVDRVPVRAVE